MELHDCKGGSIGSDNCSLTMAIMYIAIVMMTNEMSSVMPESGGQYTMAKFLLNFCSIQRRTDGCVGICNA